jgi:hypothetical protein
LNERKGIVDVGNASRFIHVGQKAAHRATRIIISEMR